MINSSEVRNLISSNVMALQILCHVIPLKCTFYKSVFLIELFQQIDCTMFSRDKVSISENSFLFVVEVQKFHNYVIYGFELFMYRDYSTSLDYKFFSVIHTTNHKYKKYN